MVWVSPGVTTGVVGVVGAVGIAGAVLALLLPPPPHPLRTIAVRRDTAAQRWI